MDKHLIDTLLDLIGFKSQVEKIANDEKLDFETVFFFRLYIACFILSNEYGDFKDYLTSIQDVKYCFKQIVCVRYWFFI